jgi:putative heme-binding domain-containing protein
MKLFAVLAIVVYPVAVYPHAALAQTNLANLNLEQGRAVFRSNCAFCHGLTGTGGRGPNLAASRFAQGRADAEFKAIVQRGVPGTTMPAFETIERDELDNLVVYIHELGASGAKREPILGDVALGRQVYQRSGCAGCHRIGEEGSILGPDLSRVGVGRPTAYIRESILDPGKDIPEDYQAVTVVLRDGKRVTGIRVNEDTFTVQLRDPSQHFRMFDKAQVADVIHETKSMMPAYTTLPQADLNNLLAYLDTLRGQINTSAGVKKAKGIQ